MCTLFFTIFKEALKYKEMLQICTKVLMPSPYIIKKKLKNSTEDGSLFWNRSKSHDRSFCLN